MLRRCLFRIKIYDYLWCYGHLQRVVTLQQFKIVAPRQLSRHRLDFPLAFSHTSEISETSLTYSESLASKKPFGVIKSFAIIYNVFIPRPIVHLLQNILHIMTTIEQKLTHGAQILLKSFAIVQKYE